MQKMESQDRLQIPILYGKELRLFEQPMISSVSRDQSDEATKSNPTSSQHSMYANTAQHTRNHNVDLTQNSL